MHGTPKTDRESADAHEARTWRNKLTTDEEGNGIIRGKAFHYCLCDAAKYLGLQVPGKGKRTYGKIFQSGTAIYDPLPLKVKPVDVEGVRVHVNADGVRGSGKRVFRTFPTVRAWGGKLTVHVLDDAITQEVLAQHFDIAGKFIGVGQYRPQNQGENGRFEVTNIKPI
jgi:hypothetical protein